MLEIRNVTKIYRPKKGVPVTALAGISLKFPDRGMVFILGKSGSGKSTLLNILGGLDQYDTGEVIIKGKSSRDFNQSDFDSYRNTYIGFIFQEYNILEEFTVGANIGLALNLQGREATSELINEILEQVDLAGYADRKPNELSIGQLQRVAIARALVKNPEIIMADEPTGALDSKTGKQVLDTLKKLSQTKLVIIVSHDREFAETYADRIIELADGKIISDVERYKVEAEKTKQGINVIDDNFLYIKKGYKLSVEDIEIINQYLEKANQDVIISIDNRTNEQIRRVAKIDEEGYRESFKQTDETKIITPQDANNFKLIRSKLPFFSSLKIGASGLRVKPVRLFFTILLSFIAFTLFGLADTMGSYNKINTSVRSFKDANIQNLSFTKHIYQYHEEWNTWLSYKTGLDNKDISFLKEKLAIDFKPVYNPSNYYMKIGNIAELENVRPDYYSQKVSGFVEFTKEELESLGFTIYGNMPTEFDQIAITSYHFEHYDVGGYRSPDGNIEIKSDVLNNYNDLLNKTIEILGEKYTITGIIDTKFDSNRYELLKTNTPTHDLNYYMKYLEFENVLSYGYHALVFVKPGFIEKQIEKQIEYLGNDINIESSAYAFIDTQPDGYYIHYIGKLDDKRKVVMFDKNKSSLANDEIVVPFEFIIDELNFYDLPVKEEDIPDDFKNNNLEYTMKDYFNDSYKLLIDEYAKANLAEAITKGFNPYKYLDYYDVNDELPLEMQEEAYGNYLINGPGYLNNEYGDKSGITIEWEVKLDIINRYDILPKKPITRTFEYDIYTDFDYLTSVSTKIVGVIIPDKSIYINYNDYYQPKNIILVADELYDYFEKNVPGPFGWAIGRMPSSESDLRKIVIFSETNHDGIMYEIENEVSYMLRQVNNFIENTAEVFLYIGIFFAVFSSLLLFNFISTSINYKRRDIGVLRAIGARSKDVFGIFFNESLIIALINFALALIATIGSILLLNNYFKREYGLFITILNFGIRQVLLMFVVSVGVALIASFLPVYRIARKRPIDAIRNR